ncbi:MAG TPA: hypothetical protein VIJ64_10700 [Candidatus Lustribacter sp.]
MDQNLVRALSSFITRSSDYSLARLEFATRNPQLPAPPILDRLPDASERTLRQRWEELERQLDVIMAFIREFDEAGSRVAGDDVTFRWLARTAKELDQYGRALRWVLTVTERDSP